jgi:hypothetical protein
MSHAGQPSGPAKPPVMIGFMCGCVAEGSRDNRVERCDRGHGCLYTPDRLCRTVEWRVEPDDELGTSPFGRDEQTQQ